MALRQMIGSYYILVVVECSEFGSYEISFTNTQGTSSVLDDEVEAEGFECATDVGSAVLSAKASTIFSNR